jgi:hypothetical protein
MDLLVRASKRNPKDLPKSEQVLFAALRMFHSQAAIARMAETLQVSRIDAESTLARLPNAAIAIAAERRMEQFVDVANRIRINPAFPALRRRDHVHTSARASTLDTCIAVHVLPRAVGMPRVLSVSAMECNDGAPCL